MPVTISHFSIPQGHAHQLLTDLTSTQLEEWLTQRGIGIALPHDIKLEKRRREWLISRLLLNEALPGLSLSHLPTGKPLIADGPCISFSHCLNRGVLLVAARSCGCDIQVEEEKIMRIRHRFANAAEHEAAPGDSSDALRYYTLLWSAKEAIFKCFGERVDFAGHISIRPFTTSSPLLVADYQGVHGSCTFELEVRWDERFCLVCTALPDNGLHEVLFGA